ncbi:MAG: glycerol-3-phosphate cytidylyltransferase, partial [Lachnospiraceae bacterium]|nr:glycerol-3-phosphate cytidylyltransferase [Lachnospiraceae bacterium]
CYLIISDTSVNSRNNTCGKYIGEGLSVKRAIKKVGMVVEGINALEACVQYMDRYNIDMPITRGMDLIINKGADPKKIMTQLMTRREKKE